MRSAILAACLLTAAGVVRAADAPDQKPGDEQVVLENDYLKLSISPVGARIVSLFDKLHNREEVKNLPYASGMNVIRYGGALNLNDQKDRYELQVTKLPDGSQKLTAIAQSKPTEEIPGAATATKEYLLAPGSSCVRLSLSLHNDGQDEIGLIPWVWHLLNRGTREQPEEAHMTEYGAYNFKQPLPDPRGKKIAGADAHYFPASNWTSRVVLPLEDGSNALATVTRPQDMLKVYNWHRPKEDFCTQELIAAPIFAKAGESCRWDYFLVLAAPVRNIVYCSPELIIGATPHPTWISASDKEISLDFSATRDVANLSVHGELVEVGHEQEPLSSSDFTLAKVNPQEVSKQNVAVKLEDRKCYQLRLTFTLDGKPYWPGALAEGNSPVIIPLIVGKQDHPPVVFPTQTERDRRLRHIQPTARKAKLAYSSDAFDAFSFPTAQRCFRQDTFEANGNGPLQMFASAGEYESVQVILTPKSKSDAVFQVAATELAGPDGGKVICESANDFIYVPTQIPSQYNAMFPVGEYPEALLPTRQITIRPEGNHPLFVTYHVPRDARPGSYHGSILLTQGATRHEIPVEMTVWNFQMPLRSKGMEFASSLKGNAIPGAKHADGTPLSREEQVDAIEDMHLKYRLTPCDSGIVNLLLQGKYPAFEKKMQKFIDGGATRIFLGQAPALLKSYGAKLPEIEKYLEQKGWTDYFYARPGFDEASSDLVPQIKAMCQEWKKVSRIKLMETYYHDDPTELYGWIDIWSRSFPVQPWMIERRKVGDVFWKVNAMPGTLEVEPWDQGRKRYVVLWDYRFTGSYNWTVKAWSGVRKWGEDYWCDGGVGNLAAVLMWPHETGILSTIRLEAMRDGLEDNAMLWMLREKVEALKDKTPGDPAQAKALTEARDLCNSGPLGERIKSVEDLLRVREKAGNALSALNTMP